MFAHKLCPRQSYIILGRSVAKEIHFTVLPSGKSFLYFFKILDLSQKPSPKRMENGNADMTSDTLHSVGKHIREQMKNTFTVTSLSNQPLNVSADPHQVSLKTVHPHSSKIIPLDTCPE